MKTLYTVTLENMEIEILNPGSLPIPNLTRRLSELQGA